MSRVLLVDTNVSSAPIHDYLIGEGHEVYVVGGNQNDFIAKISKHHINLDYSNVDALANLIERLGIDFLVPGCNDLSYLVCAKVNAMRTFFGIEPVQTTEIINDKELFRNFARDIGMPVPKVHAIDRPIHHRPLVVKPVDAFSGRGMTAVCEHDPAVLAHAIQTAQSFSRKRSCVVEDYVTGQLHSHTAFICQQEIVKDFIVHENGTANPFVVDTSCVVDSFPPTTLDRIRKSIAHLAKTLHLLDGLVHTQFLLTGDDFCIIEVTRRCPGDLYSQLIELSTGFPYAEMYTRPFLNLPVMDRPAQTRKNWIVRHTVSQPDERHWTSLEFHVPVQIVKHVSLSVSGDFIQRSPFSRIALVFMRSESNTEHRALYARTLSRTLYTIH